MTDITQTLLFVGIIACLCPCLILAFYELEQARQRRERRNQLVRRASGTVRRVIQPLARKTARR